MSRLCLDPAGQLRSEQSRRVLRAIASDGVVTLRPPKAGDAELLIAGRDEESRRWLGPQSSDPMPTACILLKGEVIGWVDYDTDRSWLEAGEVNIGYNVFADHLRRGYAARAIRLFLAYLGRTTTYSTATFLINTEHVASLALAARLGCEAHGEIEGSRYFKLPIDRQDIGRTQSVVATPHQEVECGQSTVGPRGTGAGALGQAGAVAP